MVSKVIHIFESLTTKTCMFICLCYCNKGWSIRFGERGVGFFKKNTCTRIMLEKKNMHWLTAPKKNTCKEIKLIYMIYVNLGKTGFVDFEHSLY